MKFSVAVRPTRFLRSKGRVAACSAALLLGGLVAVAVPIQPRDTLTEGEAVAPAQTGAAPSRQARVEEKAAVRLRLPLGAWKDGLSRTLASGMKSLRREVVDGEARVLQAVQVRSRALAERVAASLKDFETGRRVRARLEEATQLVLASASSAEAEQRTARLEARLAVLQVKKFTQAELRKALMTYLNAKDKQDRPDVKTILRLIAKKGATFAEEDLAGLTVNPDTQEIEWKVPVKDAATPAAASQKEPQVKEAVRELLFNVIVQSQSWVPSDDWAAYRDKKIKISAVPSGETIPPPVVDSGVPAPAVYYYPPCQVVYYPAPCCTSCEPCGQRRCGFFSRCRSRRCR